MKKHFLFLTFEFPPTHGGGLSTYMQHACAAMAEAGHQVTVLCPDANIQKKRKVNKEGGIVLVRFNPYSHDIFKYMGHWPAMSYAISDELKWAVENIGHPDIVESCDGFALPYFSMLRKATLERPFDKLKFVMTAHTPCTLIERWDGKSVYELPNYWLSVMEKWCFRAADCVQSPSQFLVDKLKEEFEVERQDIQIVRNPFRKNKVTGEEGENDKLKEPYVCVASRVSVWKGIPQLIAELNTYWLSGGGVKLLVCGQDSEDPNTGRSLTGILTEKYADHITAGRLKFLGNKNAEELDQIRSKALAQIHPSLYENFPYTVLEAMSRGSIVIANCNGGQTEIIAHGENGFIFDINKKGSAVNAIEHLLHMSNSDKKLISEKAKRAVEDLCGYEKYVAHKVATSVKLKEIVEHRKFPFVYGDEVSFDRCEDTGSGNKDPKLTVVIPYFNMHDFIDDAVESVQSSTFPAEIIIVDDGSTFNGTSEKLKRISNVHSNVRVIRKENSGVAETRNVGVKAATTEYVALLDADDLVEASYYERAVKILNKYENVSFVGCWSNDFDENGTIRYWPTFSPEPPLQYLMNMTNCQALILRREAFLAAGAHDPKLKMYLDDWEAVISLVSKGYRGVMIPSPLFNYRIRKNSIFRSEGARWDSNYEYIVRKHDQEFRKFSSEITLFLNANGPNKLYHNPTFRSALAALPGSVSAEFSGGRLMRIVNGYYRYMYGAKRRPFFLAVRKVINPLANVLMSVITRLYRSRI